MCVYVYSYKRFLIDILYSFKNTLRTCSALWGPYRVGAHIMAPGLGFTMVIIFTSTFHWKFANKC